MNVCVFLLLICVVFRSEYFCFRVNVCVVYGRMSVVCDCE